MIFVAALIVMVYAAVMLLVFALCRVLAERQTVYEPRDALAATLRTGDPAGSGADARTDPGAPPTDSTSPRTHLAAVRSGEGGCDEDRNCGTPTGNVSEAVCLACERGDTERSRMVLHDASEWLERAPDGAIREWVELGMGMLREERG